MVTYTINLDLTKDNFTVFKCKQNDDIVLNFNIYNNSLIEDLTGSAVILNALRNNNTFVKQTNNITIDKNIITINCLRDVTRVGGKLKLELVIIKDNKQTTTFNIDATVVNSVITDNAEASKNVVSVIEELDNKIAQGKEIVAEVDRKKTEAIDTVNKLKNDTIATVTELKDATITQLNNTKKDVETLKQQTITESTNIKDSAIKELSKIKTDSITELNNIKQSSIKELNSIRDTANTDLNKIKKDTIDTVNAAVNNAIAEINKYNIKEVNDKIDNHIADKNLHVTKELKDSITKNATDLCTLKDNLEKTSSNIITPSNTNLLINGDFQVWQRGESFTIIPTNKIYYTADRWCIGSDSDGNKVVKTDNGIKITVSKKCTWVNFMQLIEEQTMKKLLGKNVTLTFKTTTPTNKVNQIWARDSKNSNYHYYVNKSFNDGKLRDIFSATFLIDKVTKECKFGIQLISEAGNEIELEWAKLELGDKATPFVPRLYGEELMLCQRYYQNGRFQFAFGYGDGNLKGGSKDFMLPMRVAPTLKHYDNSNNMGKCSLITKDGGGINNTDLTFITVNSEKSLRAFNSYSSSYIGFEFYYTADAEIY